MNPSWHVGWAVGFFPSSSAGTDLPSLTEPNPGIRSPLAVENGSLSHTPPPPPPSNSPLKTPKWTQKLLQMPKNCRWVASIRHLCLCPCGLVRPGSNLRDPSSSPPPPPPASAAASHPPWSGMCPCWDGSRGVVHRRGSSLPPSKFSAPSGFYL